MMKLTRMIPSWLTRKLALFGVLLFVTACTDSGCDCEGFEEADFPEEHYDKTVPRSGQVRVTSSGLDFLGDQVPTLIEELQPGGLSFCVPPDNGSPEICTDSTCDNGDPGCQIDMEIEDAQLTPVPSNSLNVDITIGDLGGRDANDDRQDVVDVHMAGADCHLVIYNSNGDESLPGQLQATLPVLFNIDQNSPTRDLRIELGDIEMDDFTDQVDYDVKSAGGWWSDVTCTVGGWAAGLFNGTINDMIRDELESVLHEVEAEQLCRTCEDGDPVCPANATCGDNAGVQNCLYSDDTCVPANLGMEGDLMLGQLIGDYSQNPDNAVHIMAKAADHAEVDTGLSLGIRVGAQPSELGRCVPVDPTVRPSFDAIPPSPSILTNTRADGSAFMMGLGIHERALEQIFWSAWASGALCMALDSDAVSQLSTGTIGALLPSLQELAGDKAAMVLQIAPQTPPEVELGANDVVEDGDSYTINDPLMTLVWDDLDLHFYVFAHERFTRVFTLRADLAVPIALAADGQGSIIPVLGNMEEAVGNVRPLRTELLAEDPQRIIDLVPTLVGFALPSLMDSLSDPIELPEFFGLSIGLEQDDITSVDNNTMIALYADLVPVTQAYTMMLETRILSSAVEIESWTDSGVPRPLATIDVDAGFAGWDDTAPGGDIEYSWRVNGGAWSLFTRSERLEIRDPTLVLQGKHRVEVRARFRGEPATTELDAAVTYVTVDYSAPKLSIERDDALVRLVASDAADADHQLRFRYRLVDGIDESRWTPWSSQDTLDLDELGAPEHVRLVAQVKDRAGHVTEEERNIVWEPTSLEDTPGLDIEGDEPKAGCQSAGGSSPVGAAGLLLILGAALLMWRRRSRPALGRIAVLVAAIGLLGATGCDDGISEKKNPGGDACEPECAQNEECVDGTCELIDGGCYGDDECDCPTGEVGVCNSNGMCTCEPSCLGGCDEGAFCCYETNSCQEIPDPCADQVCDPGFKPEVISTGAGDSTTCEVSGASCDCVSLPPLPIGVHGMYAAVAERDGVRAASVYNQTYTDLMVATIDSAGEPSWQFVDGVPDSGDIEGALDGPRGGIADPGEDVGTHTSIGVDADGTLHVLYRHEEQDTLEYARGTDGADGYSFETTTVDDAGETGFYTSVLIDEGVVHLAYAVRQVEDADEGWQSQLRYASFATDAPLDALDLEPTVVHAAPTANPCGGACARFELCYTHTDAFCSEPSSDCAESCGDGLDCYDGNCEPYYSIPTRAYPLMVGLFAQLSKTDEGLALTFYDHLQQEAGWAVQTDQGWQPPEFLGAPSGPYVSGAVDADGVLHLAYMEPTQQELIYEAVGEGVRERIISGVRDTAEAYVLADIGEDLDLRLADDGTIQVLFHDATWHSLHLATRDTGGTWSVDTLAEVDDPFAGSHGFYGSMVRDPASSDLAIEFVIDNQADPKEGRAEFHDVP